MVVILIEKAHVLGAAVGLETVLLVEVANKGLETEEAVLVSQILI